MNKAPLYVADGARLSSFS